jgi:anti-sigma B factor antagonist
MSRPTPASASCDTAADGTKVVTLDGEFDLANAPAVGHRLEDLLADGGGDVIVDLRGVCFLDSGMLRALVIARQAAGARGRRLVVIRPNPRVWKAFTLTGVDRVIPAAPDLARAFASLSLDGVASEVAQPG